MRARLRIAADALFIAEGCSRKPGRLTATHPTSLPNLTSAAGEGERTARRGTFTIGKTTTYFTGPVDKNGYIDYAAALNERMKEGRHARQQRRTSFSGKPSGRTPGTRVPAGYFDGSDWPTPPPSATTSSLVDSRPPSGTDDEAVCGILEQLVGDRGQPMSIRKSHRWLDGQ